MDEQRLHQFQPHSSQAKSVPRSRQLAPPKTILVKFARANVDFVET